MKKTIIIDDQTTIFEDDTTGKKIKRKRPRVLKKISNVTPIICLLIFLLLGFVRDAWHPGWVVFLLIPFVEIITSIPVNGKIKWTSLAFLVSVVGYLLLGFLLNAWHPGWLIFFLVPITGILSRDE